MGKVEIWFLLKKFPFLTEVTKSRDFGIFKVPLDEVDENDFKCELGSDDLLNEKGLVTGKGFPKVFFAVCGHKVKYFDSVFEWDTGKRNETLSIGDQIYKLNLEPTYIVKVLVEKNGGKGRKEITVYDMTKFSYEKYYMNRIKKLVNGICK